MSDQPLVSIIIPVFNGEDYLNEAIESALNQTYKNIEIIIVNDGSTDKTERIAMSYQKKVRYYYKKNGGVASALNFAIKKMRGAYFSWLSHDDYYIPYKIEHEMEAIEYGKKDAIVYSNFSLLEQEKHIFSIYKIEDYYSEKERNNGILMLTQSMISGCTLLIPISHFKQVGIFNEELQTTQDYDMWFRLFRRTKLIHVSENLVVSRIHATQGSKTIKSFGKEREELFLNFLKNLSPLEQQEIWGDEYTCLQNFSDFFETNSMKKGYEYVRQSLSRYKEPKDIFEKQYSAKIQILSPGNSMLSRIAIMGAGIQGKKVLRMLSSREIHVNTFLDNNPEKWGTQVEGIPCTSVKNELNYRENTLVILAGLAFGEMQKQLEKLQFKNIITKMELEGILYKVPPKKG